MSNENVQEKEVVAFKDANVAEKICCFAWFIFQLAVTLFFMLGFCQVNGREVMVLTFLNNIVDIFSLQWSLLYYYASSCAQGVLYLVFFILFIKNIIRSSVYWSNAKTRKAGMEESFKSTFQLAIKYMLLSCAFNQVRFTAYARIAVVFMAIAFVVLEGIKVLSTKRKPTALYLVTRFAYAAVVCALLVLCGSILCRNSFENVWNGLGLIFGYMKGLSGAMIVQTIYVYIVKDVFYIVLMFVFFAIISELSESKTVLGIGEWKGFLSVSAVFVCVDLVVYYSFVGDLSGNVLAAIFEQLKMQSEIFSLLLFAIVGVLTAAYPIAKRYAPKKEVVVVDAEDEDEDEEEQAAETGGAVSEAAPQILAETAATQNAPAAQETPVDAPTAQPNPVFTLAAQPEPVEKVVDAPETPVDGEEGK